ncbi:hypothetical protein FAM18108_02787 [Lacticaseibacillus paracasei]|nr:hypothetical protein FAM18108_02787 [Lacticaseibacillus paracasei]
MTVAIFGHRGILPVFRKIVYKALNTPVNMASMGLRPTFR